MKPNWKNNFGKGYLQEMVLVCISDSDNWTDEGGMALGHALAHFGTLPGIPWKLSIVDSSCWQYIRMCWMRRPRESVENCTLLTYARQTNQKCEFATMESAAERLHWWVVHLCSFPTGICDTKHGNKQNQSKHQRIQHSKHRTAKQQIANNNWQSDICCPSFPSHNNSASRNAFQNVSFNRVGHWTFALHNLARRWFQNQQQFLPGRTQLELCERCACQRIWCAAIWNTGGCK